MCSIQPWQVGIRTLEGHSNADVNISCRSRPRLCKAASGNLGREEAAAGLLSVAFQHRSTLPKAVRLLWVPSLLGQSLLLRFLPSEVQTQAERGAADPPAHLPFSFTPLIWSWLLVSQFFSSHILYSAANNDSFQPLTQSSASALYTHSILLIPAASSISLGLKMLN